LRALGGYGREVSIFGRFGRLRDVAMKPLKIGAAAFLSKRENISA
jgi:hypothetical protein